MADTFYAWSDIYAGGESEKREAAGGRLVKVINKRNIIRRGEKVTQAKLGVEKEEFDALVASGSVRAYPLPEGADDMVSPSNAFLSSVLDSDGDVDINKLMDLGLQNPGVATEASESDTPKGA